MRWYNLQKIRRARIKKSRKKTAIHARPWQHRFASRARLRGSTCLVQLIPTRKCALITGKISSLQGRTNGIPGSRSWGGNHRVPLGYAKSAVTASLRHFPLARLMRTTLPTGKGIGTVPRFTDYPNSFLPPLIMPDTTKVVINCLTTFAR